MAYRNKSEGYDRGSDWQSRCAYCNVFYDAEQYVGGEASIQTYTTTGTVYHPEIVNGERSWSTVDLQVEQSVSNRHKSCWFCGSPSSHTKLKAERR